MRQSLLNIKKMDFFVKALIVFSMVLSSAFAASDIGPRKNMFKIQDIQIRGLKKVEKEAILEKLSAQKGMMLDNYVLKKDLNKIYSLKYFEHVEARQEKIAGKNTLVFVVKEKPIVSKITFEGNDEIDDDDLKTHLNTKEFAILDISTIKTDVKALEKQYEEKGFFLAAIDYKVRKLNNENIELVYNIKEFDKVRVKKVSFLGNKAFSDIELKGIMETREEDLFSFMSGSGSFKEFNFQTDIERIKYFYKTKGYLLVNVGTPEVTVSEDKRWVFVSVKLTEGPEFKVNDINFQGEVLFEEDELIEKIGLKNEAVYSEEFLRKDIQILTEMYQDKGYAFANVLRTLNFVPGENKVDVEFSFEKGKIAHFGKITVKGNSKTRDKVIRRELKIREGVKFSGSELRRSKENVNRLGFFEPGSVVFNTVSPEGRDDVLDVEITVKEKNTGQISLGAGYSTSSKGFLQASVAQNNFRGLGQNLAFSLSLSSTNKTFNIGFTEPYFRDTKWTAGGDIFRTENSSDTSFEYRKKGFDTRIGYPIFEYTRLFMTYKFEDTKLKVKNDVTVDEAVENGISSSIRSTIVRDTRNHRFEPTKGIYLSFSSEYSGLGGDKKWWKNEFDGRFFKRVYGDLIFRSRLYAGRLERINSKEIPRNEKFKLGGSRNLRGYSLNEIGPSKTVTDSDGKDQTFNSGGLFSSYTQLELEHPLAREAGLKWVMFFDAGHAGEMDNFKLRSDYGVGFRWFSPIGVLRFEYGWPIGEKESGGKFNFDIGQLF